MQATRTNSYRWAIAGAIMPLQFCFGLNFFGPAALFPFLMDDFQTGRGTISLLIVAVTVAMTLLLIPAGVLVARLGTKKSLVLAGLLLGLSILGGLSPTFPVLIGLRFSLGLGAGILFPATSRALVQWFTPKELPTVNGMNLAAQSLGVATGMFAGVPIASHWGWEGAFFAYGGITLLATVLWAALGRKGPHNGGAASSPPQEAVLAMLKDRNTLVLAVAGMAPQAVFVAYSSWLPTYYHEVFGMSLARGAALVTIMPVLGVFVNVVAGVLMAMVGLRKPFLLIPCLVLPLAAFASFYVNNVPIIIVSLVILGTCIWVFLAALFTVTMELPGINADRVGLAVAVVLTFGNAAVAISPLAVGASTDAFGSYLPSLVLLAFLPLLTLVAGIFLPETGPRALDHKAIGDPPVPVR